MKQMVLATMWVAMVAIGGGSAQAQSETIGKWDIRTELDTFAGTTDVYASIQAVERDYITLLIRCQKQEFDFMVTAQAGFATNLLGVSVDSKIGDNDAVLGKNWNHSGNGKAIFHPDPKMFVQQIVKSPSKQLSLRTDVGGWAAAGFDPDILTFDLVGIKEIYDKVGGACKIN